MRHIELVRVQGREQFGLGGGDAVVDVRDEARSARRDLHDVTAAVGLVIGIWWAPLGIAAGVGVVLHFVGAVGAHLRRSDFTGTPNAAVLLLVAVAVLILRVLSA
ncbi:MULTISPECIES: DoxX family protein [unclassified Streptomyces]|uniref:DoxX family protein n=1 Tax=unclassified Streptomyces TaxID=2593676 RepID=UPI00093C18F2|nr:DoxX family protein [Streptomyces sp. TSRI0281]OKI46531.1 hypothetical protein A6A29_27205 [Streptomyces sp. TSRI0281]